MDAKGDMPVNDNRPAIFDLFEDQYLHTFRLDTGDEVVFLGLPPHPTPQAVKDCPTQGMTREMLSAAFGFEVVDAEPTRIKVLKEDPDFIVAAGVQGGDGPLGTIVYVAGPIRDKAAKEKAKRGGIQPNIDDAAQLQAALDGRGKSEGTSVVSLNPIDTPVGHA